MKIKYEQLVFALATISVIIRVFFIHPVLSDETTYFNMGRNILLGLVPYKDFFFAHPPFQIYTIALLYKAFEVSFFIGKFFIILVSAAELVIIYLIVKELANEKTAFVASLIFIISPVFIVFSNESYGFWETSLLNLLAFYFLLKQKFRSGALFLSLSFFFRYLGIIYVPLFLIFMKMKKWRFKNFFIPLVLITAAIFFLFVIIFGMIYIDNTISFQIFSKLLTNFGRRGIFQYWSLGVSFFFLGLLSAFVGYSEKNKLLLLFSIYPLLADIFLFSILTGLAYQYFLLSFPYFIIATSIMYFSLKDKFVKIGVIFVLIFAIFSNLRTLDFYLNPAYSQGFYKIASLVENITTPNDTIFGEPVMTNFVSFTTGRKIADNYLDSYVEHLIYVNDSKVVEMLLVNKPKVFIEPDNYFGTNNFRIFVQNNYFELASVNVTPQIAPDTFTTYTIFIRKS